MIPVALKLFGVAAQMLRDRLIGLVDPLKDSCGSETVFSKEEEKISYHIDD